MLHLLYIDPGSGSYFIQVIIAAILGAWFWIKNYWRQIRAFFSKGSSKTEDNSTKDNQTEGEGHKVEGEGHLPR